MFRASGGGSPGHALLRGQEYGKSLARRPVPHAAQWPLSGPPWLILPFPRFAAAQPPILDEHTCAGYSQV